MQHLTILWVTEVYNRTLSLASSPALSELFCLEPEPLVGSGVLPGVEREEEGVVSGVCSGVASGDSSSCRAKMILERRQGKGQVSK